MFAALMLLTRIAHAGLAISPAFIEVSLDKGRPQGEFIVTNTGDAEERYRISALNFSLTRDGAIQRMPGDANTLDSWIVFNPKEFVIPPKSKRSIRFVISPNGVPRPGEYVAAMELESLNTSSASGTDATGHEMKIKILSSILVPIFAQMGAITPKGDLKDTTMTVLNNMPIVQTVVVNQGNGRILLTGTYEIIDNDGKSVDSGAFPKGYVFRESERLLFASIKPTLPDGKYTVRTKITSDQLKTPLQQEVVIDWKQPPATAPAPKPAVPTATSPAILPPPVGVPAPPAAPKPGA